MKKLSYLSAATLERLENAIDANIDNYRTGDFREILDRPGATIETNIELDDDQLAKINSPQRGGPDKDGINAFRLFTILKSLPRNYATFEQVWIKLCHDELLEYSRSRWTNATGNLEKEDILTHFFGKGRNGFRDDNAAGRLWWTGKIVSDMISWDGQNLLALCRGSKEIFRTQQRRFDILERPRVFNQKNIGAGIMRFMASGNLPGGNDTRDFTMKVRRNASGFVFEAFSDSEVDSFYHSLKKNN
ncbi:MAG: hypothetical protein HWE39_05635 [Oceanospirillaceae bacterium]|nr:hypothetical protein [Oceanospirillaceae bacterium]